MGRIRCAAILGLGLVLAGCQVVPEVPRPIQPLPDDGPPVTYRDVIFRARSQATMATEAFYIDQWADVDRAAAALEDTARYLHGARAVEIPTAQKSSLDARSQALIKEAQALRQAVKARDEKKTTETMQRINLLVRELRPE